MPKAKMNDMLKRRMTATQQASELQTSDEAYQQIFREKVPVSPPKLCDLPQDKLVSFFTADFGFRPYSKENRNCPIFWRKIRNSSTLPVPT